MDMIGQTISHYKILSKLGEGGMGVVYKAEDTRLKRHVALKFLTHATGDENAKKRFTHEAQAVSALDHPNICAIYEIDETPQGQMFIAMPCYEGETLQKKIERGPTKLSEAADTAIQVASGLSKAHEKGVVHRDIKPGNIFLTSDGLAKIVDFGLAKLATQTKLTRSGATVGTVVYMSPEQARGDDVDRRSDIWSLGVMLYEMVTGRLPFRGDHEPAVVYSIMNEAAEPVTAVRTGVPMELERIIDKCMAKKPDERYQYADELVVDLKKIKNDLVAGRDTPRSRPAAPPPGKRLNKLWIPSAFVVAIAVAFFFLRPVLFGESPIAGPKPIAVISFENQTGDASYDYLQGVIPNLLITRLEQSKYLSVVTWERLHDLLNQRGKGDVKLIDKAVGFELCRMDGIDTVVLGSFSKAGDIFVTDVKVLDVGSKQLLKSASAKGEGVGSILASQVDDLGRQIARGIGLSERSLVADGRPVAEVTTRSMDAYHYFLKGQEEYYNRYMVDAKSSLEKAVELDSTFAVAWLYLGRAQRSLRDYNASDAAYAQAKRLAGSAPEKDRLYIEAIYALVIERNDQAYDDSLRELVRKYPKEKLAHFQLAIRYGAQDEYQEAIASFQEALSLDPEYGEALNGIAYVYAYLEDYPKAIEYLERYAAASPGDTDPIDSMAEMYFRLGNLDKAVELYKKTLDIRPDIGAEARIAYIAALDEDYAGAIAWCDRFVDAAPSPGLKGSGRLFQSFYQLYGCREEDALRAAEEARAVLQRMGAAFGNGGTWWMAGWARYRMKENETAREGYEKSMDIIRQAGMSGPWMEAVGAAAFGLVDLKDGRTDTARERLAEIKAAREEIVKGDPSHSLMAEDLSRLLEGEILLAEGRVDDAIEACGKRPNVGIPTMGSADALFYNFPAESDVLARAYIAKGAIDQAIAEYERLVTFNPKSRNRRLIYPLFHYRLGRLYEEKGRTPEAIREYGRFLEICKGADERKAELADARKRLEQLAAANRR